MSLPTSLSLPLLHSLALGLANLKFFGWQCGESVGGRGGDGVGCCAEEGEREVGLLKAAQARMYVHAISYWRQC